MLDKQAKRIDIEQESQENYRGRVEQGLIRKAKQLDWHQRRVLFLWRHRNTGILKTVRPLEPSSSS